MADGRTCTLCMETKSETDFNPSGSRQSRSCCRDCTRRERAEYQKRRRLNETPSERRTRLLWEEYRLTHEQHDALVEAQQNRCAICSDPPAEGKPLAIDHCHTTGVVRALLCTSCNVRLGAFEQIRESAARYLATYGAGNPLLKQ